jgi:hypothetical protein
LLIDAQSIFQSACFLLHFVLRQRFEKREFWVPLGRNNAPFAGKSKMTGICWNVDGVHQPTKDLREGVA